MNQNTQEQTPITEDISHTDTSAAPIPHHTTHHHKEKKLTTPLAIIIAGTMISISHILYGIIVTPTDNTPTSLFQGQAITQQDFPTGTIQSDVIVLEYSDTECPFCARLHPTMNDIYNEYKDRAAFVYRYFPLTQIHKNAFAEAQAIECVGKELGADKRKLYIDQLFTYKITNNSMLLPRNKKEELAYALGVTPQSFTSCLTSEASAKRVADGVADGVQAGVTGTPATFILKRDGDAYTVISLIEGAQDYAYIKTALEEALR
jgi:protein-disulfide isomerase